jgi:hypothetical protein
MPSNCSSRAALRGRQTDLVLIFVLFQLCCRRREDPAIQQGSGLTDEHTLTIKQLRDRFQTHARSGKSRGLSAAEAAERLEVRFHFPTFLNHF